MRQLTIGIIGMGFIGVSHIEAARRIGGVLVGAVADANYELARQRAEEFNIPRCYADVDEMIADPEIQVIHNCTPNHLHFSINEKIIRAGKHIFSEKPLGKTSAESKAMLAMLAEHPDVVAGVNFCYRMNPLIQDAKNRIRDGEIGTPYLVHGQYLQDWLLYDTDYNWRVESAFGGASRCVADIGSHWMDLAQCMLSSRITEVCAVTRIVLPVRKKSLRPTETFSKAEDGPYEEVRIDTEDYASVMIRFGNGVTGVYQCSQVSAGRKCNIAIEIDGSESSLAWQHETSDRMWKGHRDQNNELIMRNPALTHPAARAYTHLPAGHPEGWNDAFKNNLQAFYSFLSDGKRLSDAPCDFATFEDGHYLMRVTEAILKSSRERRWVPVDEICD